MADDGSVITFQQAVSGRARCRATGEALEKGEWRVGFETWIGGRVAMAWMKPLPFLQDCCRVEYCASAGGSQGACKATRRKFDRGDVRFVCTAGDPQKKMYLSLPAAGAALRPVLAKVGRHAFPPTAFQGLADLATADRATFYQAFEVTKAEASKFERQHPAPPPPAIDKPTPKSARAAAAAAMAAAAAEGEEGAGADGSSRPAKRARGGSHTVVMADSAAEGAGQGEESAGGEGSSGGSASAAATAGAAAARGTRQQEPEPEPEPEQHLTEYELQRLEQIRRNQERLMALNLPGLAAKLMPQPPPKPPAGAKHKGVSRKRLTEVLPRRESSRLRGIAADGTQVHSERQGEVVVVAGEVIRRYASGSMTEEQEPQERHPQGELQFESSNCAPATDESFIQLLAHAAASANSGGSAAGSSAGSAAASSPGKGKDKGRGSGSGGSGGSGGGSQGKSGPPKLMRAADMARLRLAADDVAKVTKDATTHLAFHPTTDTLIVACADKRGNVGLWHVNQGSYEVPAAARRATPILRRKPAADAAEGEQQEGGSDVEPGAAGAVALEEPAAAAAAAAAATEAGDGEEDDGEGAFDGVVSLQPQHYQYICGLKWAGGSGRGALLFTAAYDGSLRCLDVERGVSDLVVSSEDAEYSCMDVTGDGRTALLGDNEGALQLVDVRAKRADVALTVHAKKINTVHFEPTQEQVFATASTDTTIQLWDLRKGVGKGMKPLATAAHAQTCQAALFAPDGSRRLVTTSFDNSVRTWDGRAGLSPLLSIRHDNNTGRWVLPFRAVWNNSGDGVIVGNMKRFIDVFDASTGAMAAQLHSEHMTAIASRNACHPVLPVLAGATNSGRIHIYRE